jgi:uncharacterized protein
MNDGLQAFACGDTEKLSQTLGAVLRTGNDSDIRMVRGRVKVWLRETIMLMVDHPAEVKVSNGPIDGYSLIVRVEVHPEDIGKIIGKQGRNARSLRTMLLAIGHTQSHYFTLDIVQQPTQNQN